MQLVEEILMLEPINRHVLYQGNWMPPNTELLTEENV